MPGYYKLDAKGIDYITKSPSGPVARDLIKRGVRVRESAKAKVGVRTGALRASISMDLKRDVRGLKVVIGSPLPYALAHHEGTKPHIIVARSGALRFPGRGGLPKFARAVRHPGTRPNPFLRDSLPLAIR